MTQANKKSVIRAAIFDMDGLLIDSERMIMQACIAAAKEIDITYTQAEYAELIGRAWPDATRIMTKQLGGDDNFQHVMHCINAGLDKGGNVFPLKTGALALLKHYQERDIICGVASSSPISHIEERLSAVGVRDYFTIVSSGHEVENGKPHPDIYLLAMERLQDHVKFAAHECIAFEDSEPGARAAIAANLDVVVVPDLKQPSDFVRENSFKVVESLDHFLKGL
ncbi:MAG: HAD family phosphatase [Methylophilaceae bacterium]|nr:HAD family phosphatase [Methylophilaceae bacterium]